MLLPSFYTELSILALANNNKINKEPSLSPFYLLGLFLMPHQKLNPSSHELKAPALPDL